eukprot:4260564-Pleurochrysis_carterae.AAC.1
MRQNLKALPDDAAYREDEAWTRITFAIQGIWTSGVELNRSEFNYPLQQLMAYGNDMTLIAPSNMLNKVFHVFTPYCNQVLSPGDLTNDEVQTAVSPPQTLYL